MEIVQVQRLASQDKTTSRTHTYPVERKDYVLTRTPVDMSIAKTTVTTSSGWANKFTLDQ